MILGLAALGWFTLPFGIALFLFEVGLVAALQAFIFATLTAIYLGGAVADSPLNDKEQSSCTCFSSPSSRPRPTKSRKAGKSIGLGVGGGLGAVGAGVGIGIIFGKVIEAVTRQPEMRDEITQIQWLGFALTEACFFYGLVAGLLAAFFV